MRGGVNLEKNKSQDTKQKLLDSAIEVFSEKGFDGARVDEIAARAKVNKAMLYYYFSSKEKLFEEIIIQYKKDFKEIKDSFIDNVDIDDDRKIESLFQLLYNFMVKKKDVLRVMMIESIKATSSTETIFSSALPSLEIKVSNLKNKGVAVEDPITLMINSFFYMMVPAAAFIVMGEKWGDFYGFNEEDVKKKFLETYKRIRKELVQNKPYECK